MLGDISRARACGDEQGVMRLEQEVHAITAQLRGARGRNGSSRRFADVDERARTAVRKAIKRAIDELAEVHPQAAAYLERRVTTGTMCRFTQEPATR